MATLVTAFSLKLNEDNIGCCSSVYSVACELMFEYTPKKERMHESLESEPTLGDYLMSAETN